MRYFIGILPIGSILIALTIDVLLEIFHSNRYGKIVIHTSFGLIIMLNFFCQAFSYQLPIYPIRQLFTETPIPDYTSNYNNDVKTFAEITTSYYPKSTKCLLVDVINSYDWAKFEKVALVEWDYYLLYQDIRKTSNARELYELIFTQYGFDVIVMRFQPTDDKISQKFYTEEFRDMLDLKVKSNGIYIELGMFEPKL